MSGYRMGMSLLLEVALNGINRVEEGFLGCVTISSIAELESKPACSV